jgi:predicted 3-demethylubiquinone-9 3-methyltransferase (glyoxalase superfamily)
MSISVATHLMFYGSASEAIKLYESVFEEFKIQELQKYGDSDGAMAGKIKFARIKFAGHDLIIIDSPAQLCMTLLLLLQCPYSSILKI